jgi:hypothetical protein
MKQQQAKVLKSKDDFKAAIANLSKLMNELHEAETELKMIKNLKKELQRELVAKIYKRREK